MARSQDGTNPVRTVLDAGAMPERAPSPQPASTRPLTDGEPSILLYASGLGVMLSGLYAVNYALGDSGFALMTYALAIAGFTTSFVMRRRGPVSSAYRAPMLIGAALLVLMFLSGSRGLGALVPSEVGNDRAALVQVVILWMAVLHSFTLASDGAVLFTCVPSITMLALVSASVSDQPVQNAFLAFTVLATFLVVHENFLRTRRAARAGYTSVEPRHLGAQLPLVATCVMSALVLASFIAVPIRLFGEVLSVPVAAGATGSGSSRKTQQIRAAVAVNEQTTLELDTGPVMDSDVVLMHVRASRRVYLLGTTFDFYNGNRFERTTPPGAMMAAQPVAPVRSPDTTYDEYTAFAGQHADEEGINEFNLPASPYDLPPAQMKDSAQCTQFVSPAAGSLSQLYGADRVVQVRISGHSLQADPAGGILSTAPIANTAYMVVSRIASQDPGVLRRASVDAAAVPRAIAGLYLQTANGNISEDPRIRALAQQLTRGYADSYDKAEAIRQYISSHCKYDLQASAAPRDRDVVGYFLFDSKAGYCDCFAAAMTMLCRYAGIPARLASGFLPEELSANDLYTVRERDRHAWCEVFFPHVGWVPFDATEGTQIEAHPLAGPGGLLEWLRSQRWLPLGVVAVILWLLGRVIKTEVWDRRRRRLRLLTGRYRLSPANAQIVAHYLSASTRLEARGVKRMAWQTPDEFLRALELDERSGAAAVTSAMQILTALCARFRYGPAEASEEDVRQAAQAVAALRHALASTPRHAWRRATPAPQA